MSADAPPARPGLPAPRSAPAAPPRAGRDPRAVARELRVLLAFRLGTGGRDLRKSLALVVLLTVGLGAVLPAGVARFAPDDHVGEAVAVAPTVWFLFLVAAVVGTLASSGGREVLARRDAVAFPVSSTVDQLGSLVLAPLNLAWSVQAVVVVAVTAYVVGPGAALVPAVVAAWVWVAAATAVAHLTGWGAELVRTSTAGRWVLRGAVVTAVGGLALLVRQGAVGDVLDSLPTVQVFLAGISTDPARWLPAQAALLAVAVAAVLLTVPVGERLERRPRPVESGHETRWHRRRRTARGELAAAVAVDIRSILRSPPLRRGLGLLLATPLLVALLFPLPWVGVAVLPALVASGTALLHGVNVVALDGRGALWRESLPHRPSTTLVGRLLALTVLCGGSALPVVVVAGLRADPPSVAEATGAGLAVLVATAQVVSRCARWSLRHPYPADLRSARDTPAPPAAMTWYAVRLSAATTGGAVAMGIAMTLDEASLCVLVAAVLLVPSLWRSAAAFRTHDDPAARAHVAATVMGS